MDFDVADMGGPDDRRKMRVTPQKLSHAQERREEVFVMQSAEDRIGTDCICSSCSPVRLAQIASLSPP